MLRLVPLEVDGNVEDLAAELASGFGGDPAVPRHILEQTRKLHEAHPRPMPWGSYLAFANDEPVALGAFKWAPNEAGCVEIAYMTLPAFEGRGHATATAGALFEIAKAAGASEVIAHTLPEENASNRALRRNGFEFAGETMDPEDGLVWKWRRV